MSDEEQLRKLAGELDDKILEAIADAGTVSPTIEHPRGMAWMGQYITADGEWRVEIHVRRE